MFLHMHHAARPSLTCRSIAVRIADRIATSALSLTILASLTVLAAQTTHAQTANAQTATSQCAGWQPGPLTDNGPNGTNGVVYAVVPWDPDGAGPQPEGLVIGGNFTIVEGVQAFNVAFRRSDAGQWQSFRTGISGEVRSLCVHNGDLVAARRFDVAGGNACTAMNSVPANKVNVDDLLAVINAWGACP